MSDFVLSLLAFLAAHLVPTRPAVRRQLVGILGRRGYLAGYSVLSASLLAWVVVAAVRAPYVPLWVPPRWSYLVPVAVMPLALAMIGAGLAAPNPLSVTLRGVQAGSESPGLAGMRHPVMWGFALWALSHIPPNGDLVAFVMFVGFALFAFGGMKMLDRRRRCELGEERWRALADTARGESLVFRLGDNRPLPAAAGGALAGLLAYVLLLFGGHLWLFGADPLAVFR